MNSEQLSLSKTMRSFLKECLDDLDIGIESNNGHHKVRTQQEAIARLQPLRDQGTCSIFNSSLESNAWFRAYLADNLKQLNQLMEPDSSPEYRVTTAESRQTPVAVVGDAGPTIIS
ncbi:MAG: hypothetical protein L6R35_004533 [Caloplaca aegaea]|nr:MAG: hypothetical protein L6R35_004533 [Caloplaca aegaea]